MSRSWRVAIGLSILAFIGSLALAPRDGGTGGPALGQEATSDRFWRMLSVRGQGDSFDSLDAMTRGSALVVVARIESIEAGRTISQPVPKGAHSEDFSFRFANARLRVERVLSDDTLAAQDLVLELFLPPQTRVADLASGVAAERAIFFLRAKDPFRDESGNLRQLYDLVTSQGLVRDVDGLAHPVPGAEERFLLDLVHQPFDRVLADVTASASR